MQSADIGQFWKALDFAPAVLTTRHPLDRINDAIQSMRALREIKPLALPWAG